MALEMTEKKFCAIIVIAFLLGFLFSGLIAFTRQVQIEKVEARDINNIEEDYYFVSAGGRNLKVEYISYIPEEGTFNVYKVPGKEAYLDEEAFKANEHFLVVFGGVGFGFVFSILIVTPYIWRA